MLGATDTKSGPETDPVGIVTVIDPSLQEVTDTEVLLSVTTLCPWIDPKFEPVIVSVPPIGTVEAERLVIIGAGEAEEFRDTLSNVTVSPVGLTAMPM